MKTKNIYPDQLTASDNDVSYVNPAKCPNWQLCIYCTIYQFIEIAVT